MDERLRSHYESLSRAIWFTRSADSKAAPVLAVQVALVGTLAARGERLSSIIAENPWGLESAVLLVVLVVYGVFLIGAISCAIWVFVPMNPRTGRSLVYFEDIAAMDHESFQTRARNMWPNQIEGQLLDQVHRVSQVASVKMNRVRFAIVLSVPSGILWLVLLAWGSI